MFNILSPMSYATSLKLIEGNRPYFKYKNNKKQDAIEMRPIAVYSLSAIQNASQFEPNIELAMSNYAQLHWCIL